MARLIRVQRVDTRPHLLVPSTYRAEQLNRIAGSLSKCPYQAHNIYGIVLFLYSSLGAKFLTVLERFCLHLISQIKCTPRCQDRCTQVCTMVSSAKDIVSFVCGRTRHGA
jgi:hypothetical protein